MKTDLETRKGDWVKGDLQKRDPTKSRKRRHRLDDFCIYSDNAEYIFPRLEITANDMKSFKTLDGFKLWAKKRFKTKMWTSHPDTGEKASKGTRMNRYLNEWNEIKSLTKFPVSIKEYLAILDIIKPGYKVMSDYPVHFSQIEWKRNDRSNSCNDRENFYLNQF